MRRFVLAVVTVAFIRCSSFRLRRLSARVDAPTAETWTPPPDYFVDSLNHKTMYLVDATIGTGGQSFRLLVDTGSSALVVPSAACTSSACGQHHHFQPSQSTTDTKQAMAIKFGKGSLNGHIVEDDVCVQASGGAAPLAEVSFFQQDSDSDAGDSSGSCTRIAFLAADQESDDFASLPFDGILGLGLDDLGKTGTGFSFISALAKSGHVASTSFALRLGSAGSSELVFGGVDERSLSGGRALWVPLSPMAQGSWQFSVADLTIDGKSQEFGPLEVCVDSGTSLLAADSSVTQWFRNHVQPQDCSAVDKMPTVGLRLPGGSILPILPSDYIDQINGGCQLSLMPNKFQAVSGQSLILGDSFLRRYVAIFDREGGKLGFGVAADDNLAPQLLPAMFPTTTTPPAPTTTAGPPPKLDVEYTTYAPETTPPPPTAEEVQGQELNAAFSKLPDDLTDDFDSVVAKEKATLRNGVSKSSDTKLIQNAGGSDDGAARDEGSDVGDNAYMQALDAA